MLRTSSTDAYAGHPLAWLVAIVATSATAMAAVVVCAALGITNAVFYIAYIPACMAAYRYRWRGLWTAGALAVAYVGIMGSFFPSDKALLATVFGRACVVCAIAVFVAALAWGGARAERALVLQRDLALNLSGATDVDDAAERLLDTLLGIPGIDGAILLLRDVDGAYRQAGSRGFSARLAGHLDRHPPGSPTALAFDAPAPRYSSYADYLERIGATADGIRLAEGLQGIGILPLPHRGRSVGTLAIASRHASNFSRGARTAAELAAAQIGAALERLSAVDRLVVSSAQAEALVAAARALSSTTDYDQVLRAVARVTAETLGSPICEIWEYDAVGDRHSFTTMYERDPRPGVAEKLTGCSYKLDEYPEDRIVLFRDQILQFNVSDPGVPANTRQWMEEDDEKTWLHVPLRVGDEPLGIMVVVEMDHERTFTADEQRLARSLAEQAAVAIENARLYRRLDTQNRRLHELLRGARSVAGSLDLQQVLDATARAAAETVDSPECAVCEYEPHFETFAHRAVYQRQRDATHAERIGHVLLLYDHPAERMVVEQQVPVQQHIGDPALDERDRNTMEHYHQKSTLSVPLVCSGESLGFLTVIETREERRFTQDEIDLVQAFADQAAVAITNARLYRTVEEQATHDGLTGLYNHRYFRERLDQEVKRAVRYGEPMSLLMMDIDDFKQVNDNHGHLVGDEVLRAIALILQTQVRSDVDLAARYGGEEMALLLPRTAMRTDRPGEPGYDPAGHTEGAVAVAERIRKAVAESTFAPASVPGGIHLSISIGVADLDHSRPDARALVADADVALYDAKHSGKNCTVAGREATGAIVS
jgi:GGDEF domain-containing protein